MAYEMSLRGARRLVGYMARVLEMMSIRRGELWLEVGSGGFRLVFRPVQPNDCSAKTTS